MVSERSLPLITTALLIISYFATYHTGFATGFPIWIGDLDTVLLFSHPFFYLSIRHLFFDTVMWLLAGTLLEKWIGFRVRSLLAIFAICYLSTLATEYVKWKHIGPTHNLFLGPSGMISAMVPFVLFYYLFFRKEVSFSGLDVFAPFGIGVLFWWVIGPPFSWIGAPTQFWIFEFTELGDTPIIHLLAFAFASVPAFLLMFLAHRRRSRQECSPASM